MNIPKEFIGRFEVDEEIAHRPGSVVFSGRDRTLENRKIAVKVFLAQAGIDASRAKEFDAHVSKFRAASHPVLVPIIAGGIERGWFFLAMEFVEGTTLREILKTRAAPLELDEALVIIRSVGEALRELHHHNLCHGNLSSRSILVQGNRVRLAGYVPPVIAALQREASMEGRLVVEPAYISPEQIRGGQVDERSDMYALSVLLFEMVTGKRPFSGSTPLETAMLRILKAPPSAGKIYPHVPPLIDAIAERGLESDPTQRFQTIVEMLEALNAWEKPLKNPFAEIAARLKDVTGGSEAVTMAFSLDEIRAMLRVGTPQSVQLSPAGGSSRGTALQKGDLPSFSLLGVSGDFTGKRFFFAEGEFVIGSDPKADLCMNSEGMPPQLAKVMAREGACFLTPLAADGVMLNGKLCKKNKELTVKEGDVLEFGSCKLQFSFPENPPSSAVPAAQNS